MQILFVEDKKSFAEALIANLKKNITNLSIDHVISRDSAVEALNNNFYDLVILDLSIQANNEDLSVAPEHGHAVFYKAREISCGTPIYILTGSEPDQFAMGLIRLGENIDIWGTGTKTPTIVHIRKEDVRDLLSIVKEIADEIEITNQIHINKRGKVIELTPEYSRSLKVATRHLNGASCNIELLTGGLSSSIVLKVIAIDHHGNELGLMVAKLGRKSVIERENQAYNSHVKLLGLRKFTPLLYHLDNGLRGYAGIFYTLAEGYRFSFFDIVENNITDAPASVHEIRSNLDRWTNAKTLTKTSIQDIRRSVLNDQDFTVITAKYSLNNLEKIESIILNAFQSCIHGDLHGGNILVDDHNNAVLIDFGKVGVGISCLDPIALELSLLFHPDGNKCSFSEALKSGIEHWPNIDVYLKDHPLAPVLNACRSWAYDVSGSDIAVLAAGYAFAVRQLKFDTIDKKITLKLVESIVNSIHASQN